MLHRQVFALSVSWLIYACHTGIGGPVNRILSFRFLIPLSSLSYTVIDSVNLTKSYLNLIYQYLYRYTCSIWSPSCSPIWWRHSPSSTPENWSSFCTAWSSWPSPMSMACFAHCSSNYRRWTLRGFCWRRAIGTPYPAKHSDAQMQLKCTGVWGCC